MDLGLSFFFSFPLFCFPRKGFVIDDGTLASQKKHELTLFLLMYIFIFFYLSRIFLPWSLLCKVSYWTKTEMGFSLFFFVFFFLFGR